MICAGRFTCGGALLALGYKWYGKGFLVYVGKGSGWNYRRLNKSMPFLVCCSCLMASSFFPLFVSWFQDSSRFLYLKCSHRFFSLSLAVALLLLYILPDFSLYPCGTAPLKHKITVVEAVIVVCVEKAGAVCFYVEVCLSTFGCCWFTTSRPRTWCGT